jgi:hypothetical protein
MVGTNGKNTAMSLGYLAAVLLTVATPAEAHEPDLATSALRKKEVGRLIPAKLGEEVAILLPSYVGNRWRWVARHNSAITLTAPIRTIEDPERHGSYVSLVKVRLDKPGRTQIEFADDQGGSGGSGAANTLRFRFIITS